MLVDAGSQMRYIQSMKTATLPPVRVEPEFRKEVEDALTKGETIASLVEDAVRVEVNRRRTQEDFVRRGLHAIARSEEAGDWIPAEQVIAKLESKLADARERMKHRVP